MSTEARVLTVRQPWAWAIAIGAKPVENRTMRTHYRGPLWIHAGLGWSDRGAQDPRVLAAARTAGGDAQRVLYQGVRRNLAAGHVSRDFGRDFSRGAVVARVQLVDCHPAAGCCTPWGEDRYVEAGGRVRSDVWHWRLADVERLAEPVERVVGRLGLWHPDPDLLEALPS